MKTAKLGRDPKRLIFISLRLRAMNHFWVVPERKLASSSLWSPGKEVVLICEVSLPFLCSLLSSLCLWYLPQPSEALSEHLHERALPNATELSRDGPVSSASTSWEARWAGVDFSPG